MGEAALDPLSGLGLSLPRLWASTLPLQGTNWAPWYSPEKRWELQLQRRQEAPKVPGEAFLVTYPQSYIVTMAELLLSSTLAS